MRIITNLLQKLQKMIYSDSHVEYVDIPAIKEPFDGSELTEAQKWRLLITAIIINMIIAYYLIPFLWNQSVKPVFGTKALDGKMAVALVFLLDLLLL